MNYESLQLVNYDGEFLPTGYLFGALTAELSITYLKSIGAPQSAIEKVKDVEVSKIITKSYLKATATDGYVATNTDTGATYGGGNPMIPAAATQIHHFVTGDKPVSEHWKVEPAQAQAPQQQQLPQTPEPQVLGSKTAGPAAHLGPKTPDKVGPETTSDIKDLGGNRYQIDLNGNKPNIAMNLLTLLGRYSPKQAKSLEKFILAGGKIGPSFTLSLDDIPQDILDEMMPWVLDPNRHYMSIHQKLNRMSKITSEESPIISPEVRKKMGETLSGDMLSLFDSVDFVDMVNSGAVKLDQIDSVFPALASALKLAKESNEDKEIPSDFTLDPGMFLVRWDAPAKQVEQSLGSISEAIKMNAMTLAEFNNRFKNKGNSDIDATGAVVLPVLNIIMTQDNDAIITEMAKYSSGLDTRDEKIVSEVGEKLDTLRDYILANQGKEGFPSVDAIKDLQSAPRQFADLISRDDFPLKGKDSAIFVDLMITLAKEATTKKDNSVYGARKGGGLMRQIPRIGLVAQLTTSFDQGKGGKGAMQAKKERAIKLFKVATSLSMAAFNDGHKDSTFKKGVEMFTAAHEVLKPWSGGFDALDFMAFARISPLVMDGGDMVFITDQCEVKRCHVNASVIEKELFAMEVYGSLRKLVSSGTIPSERAAYAMVAITDPSLAKKFKHKANSAQHMITAAAQEMYQATASATGSFVTSMLDPILGQRIQNGVGGPSLVNKMMYKEFKAKNAKNDIAGAAQELFTTGRGSLTLDGTTHTFNDPDPGINKLAFEAALKDHIAKQFDINPSDIRPGGRKPESKGEIANQIVRAYSTLGKFTATMQLLNDDAFVTGMLDGKSRDELSAIAQSVIPGIHPTSLGDIKFPDMGQFIGNLGATFAGHADGDKKIAAVKLLMKQSIHAGAKIELDPAKEDPLAATQLSETFEGLSAVGNFMAQLASYKDHTVTGVISNDARGIGSLVDDGVFVELSSPEGRTEQVNVGKRRSTESGSHIDAFNSRVTKGKLDSGKIGTGISLGFLEFKFLSGSNANSKVAHLLATNSPMRDLVKVLQDYDEISFDPVLNATNMIDSPEKSHVAGLKWGCHLGAGTEMSNDGNKAHGIKTEYGGA